MTAACLGGQLLAVIKCRVMMLEYFTRCRTWTGSTEAILCYNVANGCRCVFTQDKKKKRICVKEHPFCAVPATGSAKVCIIFFYMATTNQGVMNANQT